MKVIAYYVKPFKLDELSSFININYINDTNKYKLYAYTNDKNIAKKFESSRNMDCFIKKKISIPTNDEKLYRLKLSRYNLMSKNNNEKYIVEFIMTEYENSIALYELSGCVSELLSDIENHVYFYLYKDHYIRFLCSKFHLYNQEIQEMSDFIYDGLPEISDISDGFDDLALFILAFGVLLKEGS